MSRRWFKAKQKPNGAGRTLATGYDARDRGKVHHTWQDDDATWGSRGTLTTRSSGAGVGAVTLAIVNGSTNRGGGGESEDPDGGECPYLRRRRRQGERFLHGGDGGVRGWRSGVTAKTTTVARWVGNRSGAGGELESCRRDGFAAAARWLRGGGGASRGLQP
jgi:hypothetical protein